MRYLQSIRVCPPRSRAAARRVRSTAVWMFTSAIAFTPAGRLASAQTTVRINLGPGGIETNAHSGLCAICMDGRYAAFESLADNLIDDDTNEVADMFVCDLTTGELIRASVDSNGVETNLPVFEPSLSGDGRFITFSSLSDTLVPDDDNDVFDIFLRDRDVDEDGLFDEPEAVATTRVSVSSAGQESDGDSDLARISGDGRFIAFASTATDLVESDGNNVSDIFVHDRIAGTTERVSKASDGEEGFGPSFSCSISGDGRFVAFDSFASNLVDNDDNGNSDIFVHDRETGETQRVSLRFDGTSTMGYSLAPSISADGSRIAFASNAPDLVENDSNRHVDVFVRDLLTETTVLASRSTEGVQGDADSFSSAISADGGHVTFVSPSNTLVPDDGNGVEDVFTHDIDSGTTLRASLAADGSEGNLQSLSPAISGDATIVLFRSAAVNLVEDDLNGFVDVFARQSGGSGCEGALPGDITGDGAVDAQDVADFVGTLLDGPPWLPDELCAADLNQDGQIDGDDVPPFILLLDE